MNPQKVFLPLELSMGWDGGEILGSRLSTSELSPLVWVL